MRGGRGTLASSALVVNFEDYMDSALSRYSRLPAIPDRNGRLPGQKRNDKVIVHLPPLDPIRFGALHNPAVNGLSLNPADERHQSGLRRKPAVVDEDDDAGEKTVPDRLAAALRANAARVLDLFRLWDENDDGEVSKEEFIRAFQEENGLMKGMDVFAREAVVLFDEWDTDGSGTISFAELKKLLSKRPTAAPPQRSRPGQPEPRLCYTVDGDLAQEEAPRAVQDDRMGKRQFPAPPRRTGGVTRSRDGRPRPWIMV